MIKNNIQLKRTEIRLQEIYQQIRDLKNQYSGIKLEILITPLIDEVNELEVEIAEYHELQELSLEEAVQGPLKEPVLLDNINELLTKLRIASGFTQQELAAQLGWRQSNLSRFESENYHSQTIGKVVEYTSFLGVWLHVTPSLTERPTEVIYTKKETPITSGDISTSSETLVWEFITDSPSTLASRHAGLTDPSQSILSQEESELISV